jgi:hypothetical protein
MLICRSTLVNTISKKTWPDNIEYGLFAFNFKTSVRDRIVLA